MKKSTIKQLEMVHVYVNHEFYDTASRSLSSLIRSSRSNKEIKELMEIAVQLNLTNNINFII